MKQIFASFFSSFLKVLCRWAGLVLNEENSVIIAGHGAKYFMGNNAYLFQYFENRHPPFAFYFYTKNKTVYQSLKIKYPGKILFAYNPKTFIRMVKAKVLIITTGVEDFFPYPLPAKKRIINIWHGTPIKNIGFQAAGADEKSLTFLSEAIDYFCISSVFEGEIIQKAFHLPQTKLLLTGQPKNDFLVQNHSEFLNKHPFLNKKVILYAPTFREAGMEQKTLKTLFPLQQLQQMLEEQDAVFLYRNHINTRDRQAVEGFDRIIPAAPDQFPDAQPLLFFTDILITDYSGIYFDFLLLNRPVIFYIYDYEAYRLKRNFLFPFEENTPGPKVQTAEELFKAMEKYLLYLEKDKKWREKIKNKFHNFSDGQACKRIFDKITEIL